MQRIRSLLPAMAALIALGFLSGCASTATTDAGDPHESLNRKFYAFNDGLDRNFLQPIARGYVNVTPDPVRDGVTNFFDNVGYLNTIANDLLQGKLGQFFEDSGRFVINSTIGIGGLFDPATGMGLPQNNEDLGQTFGTWGAGEGAYLTLPLLGPSSYRDVPAPVMGIFLNPLTYLSPVITIPAGFVSAVNTRANLLDATRIRDEAALDPYTFVREAWRQQREFDIYDGNPPGDGFDEFIEGEGDAALLRVY
ncbi:MAG: MlaA family lipoprotein [Gammaproteobacteria bacterium]